MYRNELEKRYRNNANRVVLFCGLFFGLFRVVAELLAGEFRSAFTCGVISAVVVGLFIFFKEKNIKNFSLVVSFSMYVLYIVASFAIESFKYFYDYYLLTLLVCAVYFNARNFLILVVGTQVVNLVLSIFVLPYHMVGSVWVHFSLIFSSSLLLVIAVRFAVDKSNEVNNAFTSFGALMNVTPSVLILIDENNRIKYLSKSVSKVFGVKNVEELGGKNFLEMFSENSVKELFEDILKKRSFYGNYQKISINGENKTFDVVADKMSDDMSEGMFFMLNDVSDIVRLKEIAERDSLIDALTQIPNRRAFDRQILQEWSRALREQVNLSFLMMDIDNFKQYNDTYGHRQGDELLRVAGETFKRSLKRSTDFVARIGGEEFGILLHATNSHQANIIAENLRKAIEKEIILTNDGKKTRFTVSIGICSIIPNMNQDYGFIIEEADKALYKAKEKGRNQVCSVDLT